MHSPRGLCPADPLVTIHSLVPLLLLLLVCYTSLVTLFRVLCACAVLQVGHIAHLGGALAGVLLVWLLSKLPDPDAKAT